MIYRDSSVRIYGSIHSEAEDIFNRLEGGSDLEFSKERLLLLQSSLKTKIRDFLGGRVDLAVVIAMKFLIKNLLSVLDFGHIFADTGSDQAVLEPPIRSFDFASGLRGERMDNLHIALLEHVFPLRSRFIGLKVVLIPEGVSSPDKPKDRVRIDIIGERKPVP